MSFNQAQQQVLADVRPALSAFKRTFGRDLSADFLAALYVAQKLDLTLSDSCSERGCDAIDERTQNRYQIKQRTSSTQNIDINNFEFDFLVLVNLSDAYEPTGMWLLPVQRLHEMCANPSKYMTHQLSQERFKREAERIL